MKVQHLVAASAAFAASVYSGYQYAKPITNLPTQGDVGDHNSGSGSGSAFDRLALVYDNIIGNEETYMFYGTLRWWLLRKAEGNVLEISAGTGRNLSHYPYSSIHSLILTDISQPMLQQAQRKFFDELQLQYKQPDVSVKFLLSDAEHMVAEDGQAPVTVQLPPARSIQPGVRAARIISSSSSSERGSEKGTEQQQQQHQNQQQQEPQHQHQAAAVGSIWRFKNKQHSSPSSSVAAASTSDVFAAADSNSRTVEDHSSTRHGNTSSSSCSSSDSSDSSNSTDCTSSTGWRRPRAQQGSGTTCSCCRSSDSTGSINSDTGTTSTDGGSSTKSSTFPPASFDTVVDTFGLCSCQEPVQVLRQAAELLKPGGRLLLLEHGRSSWQFLNDYMDQRAPAHYKTYGCWYNRDILDIVKQAGLEIQSVSRWHFGTSYLIVATPAAAAATDVS